jgi:endo-1,4-beta-xylanase
MVAAAGSILLLGCGRSAPALQDDAAPAAGGTLVQTDGAAGAIGPPSTGGTPGSGGIGAAGIQGSGGTIGHGGEPGTGGRLGSGGAPGTGGMQVSGGATGTGGTVSGVGGSSLTGGAGGTIVGRGGIFGAGGQTSPGGSLAAGGSTGGGAGSAGTSGSGGATATGGLVGAGGATATGGMVGVGGSAMTPPFPPRFFGNIDTGNEIRSDFAKYWDHFTPENIGKWAWVQSTSANVFSWERLDAEYKYCEDNHIIFKESCFIWGPGQAGWINESNAIAAVQNWMKSFCDRYPKTRLIDVVNEPLHNTPRYSTWIGGGGRTTWDWVANSFKWAREACPNAILILNDYNIVEYSSEHGGIIELAKTILAAGAPVMAIGAQGHDVAKVPLSTVQAYVADIVSQTGLPVYFTQLDLPVADDNQQAAVLKDLVSAFWNDPSVPGITYWGYIVGRTWRSNTGLMNNDGTMRPAMTWLMDFLGR